MNYFRFLILRVSWLLALLLLAACVPDSPSSPTPTGSQLTAAQLKVDYASYAGQLVSVQGYGVIAISAPLCPGYIGMDTRLSFLDAQQENIVAVLTAKPEDVYRKDTLREFQAYVRVFKGQIGCPGSQGEVTFPYLEIVGVKE